MFFMNDERDKFSGLHGRVYGLAQLERALAEAKQQGKMAAVLFTDFDRYKTWNDKHGHNHLERRTPCQKPKARSS
jgi:GGDEF domain-containing protein